MQPTQQFQSVLKLKTPKVSTSSALVDTHTSLPASHCSHKTSALAVCTPSHLCSFSTDLLKPTNANCWLQFSRTLPNTCLLKETSHTVPTGHSPGRSISSGPSHTPGSLHVFPSQTNPVSPVHHPHPLSMGINFSCYRCYSITSSTQCRCWAGNTHQTVLL